MELLQNGTVRLYDVCSVLCCHITYAHKCHIETSVNKCLAVINDSISIF
jgi:hypothetical protein